MIDVIAYNSRMFFILIFIEKLEETGEYKIEALGSIRSKPFYKPKFPIQYILNTKFYLLNSFINKSPYINRPKGTQLFKSVIDKDTYLKIRR